ncbi:MAG: T9SS type A sorting domain-containing protein, partial [Rhodothermales bacterium]|nr:T9SS type A sorting domain-containing protein [Rhodothermales bacterium]
LALGDQQIISIAVDPNDDDVVYAGANLSGVGSIYRSTNGGDGWQRLMTFNQPVWAITVDPSDSDRILVGTLGDGIHESTDGGQTFMKIGSTANGLGNDYVFALEFGPSGGPFAGDVIAGTDDGVYVLGGGTWSEVGVGSRGYRIRSLAFAGTTIQAGTWGEGIIEFDPSTGTWFDFGLADIPVIAFAVHPVTGDLIIGTGGQGLFLSRKSGAGTDTDRNTTAGPGDIQLTLESNYPNPFNPATTVPFEMRENGRIRISVVDVLGREINVLIDRHVSAGRHTVTWNAEGVPSGTYLIRAETDTGVRSRPAILLK